MIIILEYKTFVNKFSKKIKKILALWKKVCYNTKVDMEKIF